MGLRYSKQRAAPRPLLQASAVCDDAELEKVRSCLNSNDAELEKMKKRLRLVLHHIARKGLGEADAYSHEKRPVDCLPLVRIVRIDRPPLGRQTAALLSSESQ
jgi:hypothetical protein